MSPKKPKPLRECFRRNNKLTIEQVREIKKLLAMGEHPAMIAPQFGVKKATVCSILYGSTWQNVENF